MSHDLDRRRNLTFSQAEGLGPLPRPLALGEMPRAFRVEAWSAIHESMRQSTTCMTNPYAPYLKSPWRDIAKELWVGHFHVPADEVPFDSRKVEAKLKAVIMEGRYHEVFDLLTALARRVGCLSEIRVEIARLLQVHQMAYYLDTSGPPAFVPQSSPEEGEATRAAMSALADSDGMDGARAHLRNAAEAINQGKFADAVRESINAVESVAKVIGGDESKTLSPALKELEKRGLLPHKALTAGLEKLYGYTSDEKGIRHSLLEKGIANVGQEEAAFMFGACASFCGYLCRKRAKISAENALVGD